MSAPTCQETGNPNAVAALEALAADASEVTSKVQGAIALLKRNEPVNLTTLAMDLRIDVRRMLAKVDRVR